MRTKGFNTHTKYVILKHALKENNVSQTCDLFGISRTTFYNWQRDYQKYGMIGLESKEPKKPEMPNKVSKHIEQEILAYVARYPVDGPKQIYYELRAEGMDVGETGIYNVLKRNRLTRKAQRVEYSRNKSLHIKKDRKEDKVEPSFFNKQEPYAGYLVLQRINYIGSFDKIGRIYQYTFYDTISKWATVKIYNKKLDIDVWDFFEVKLVYLLRIFNIIIENLVTEKDKAYLPYFVKGNRYKEIIENLNINHIFVSPEENKAFKEIREFDEFLLTEFYNKINLKSDIDSFSKVEHALNRFVRGYNFKNLISKGPNAGKTPVEVVLERALHNNVDLDTLPLWISALITSSKRGDKDE